VYAEHFIAVSREIKAEIFRNVLYGVFKKNKNIFHSCNINMQEKIKNNRSAPAPPTYP